ncbi:HvfC/BufC N-terminal domain-containing protein [Paucibacter sp. KCTC 42545]|uniref:HvfC/BufC N-terminal domain-containing protein n=1 Tax=Paucibacter sp. KCTC 42545 TaxID=1768242 RepID=UPI000733A5ED|nr:DNA-binding domain-containing protein [Paucibacter sp. KCTC 42545]ALT79154.1 hypothetical protein AT984_20135 [Paucibacter sp. KCTC 42545]
MISSPANTATVLRRQQQRLQFQIAGEDSPDSSSGPATFSPGLRAYRHAYRARLQAALRDNYLVLHRALGDEAFDALALRYLNAHPPHQPSIRWFGDGLAEFMADEAQLHPSLIELARMDWALRAAFDAAEAAALLGVEDLAALAPEDWGGQCFRLQPSVQLLPLQWAIEPAWRQLREYEPEQGEAEPELAEPEAHAHWLLIWRDAALETRWRSLEPLEAQQLLALQAGDSFASLCEMAAAAAADPEQSPHAAALAAQALGRWLGEGLLARN